ncbi:hypothetical protein B0T25DRAFT_365827 [Lasiosphaeria hispida]|uniref:Uncharacterized protein n=1 Tax=Lasiosphaeria hispida TaxID=260671 RepID=A0AAJ0H5M4_9PEZI|nr:hypothetical protein B0T25DRAFT_365827 [Lasiosphaeria hispida]
MSTTSSHKYPGVNLPLRDTPAENVVAGDTFYRIGAHPSCPDSQTELLQIREIAMLNLMDRLTDKPNWHEKLFDDQIVAKWRDEALAQPEDALYAQIIEDRHGDKELPLPTRARIISPASFDFCISELRGKAAYFRETGLIWTLNSKENIVVKSDTLVPTHVREGLKAAFVKLHADQADSPDWHPWTSDMVQDLVHPSMYPFVYGRSNFIREEVVGVSDAVDKWAGKGHSIPKTEIEEPLPRNPQNFFWAGGYGAPIPDEYWSSTYQWLPSNLAFQDDGTVRFTSYINSLHPKKHQEIYDVVEKLIDISLPAWDAVLHGRSQLSQDPTDKGDDVSIQTRFDLPPEANEITEDEIYEALNLEMIAAYEEKNGTIEIREEDLRWEQDKDAARIRHKWRKVREPIYPEPREYEPVTYVREDSIRRKFKDNGLQVIVKMATIELTPEKPDFPAGGWHIEGQMNEHIAATSLYYLDSENITPSHLSFRMQVDGEQEELQELLGQDSYEYFERIFGGSLGPSGGEAGPCLQNFGSLETRQGRLLAFPNVFQHRVSPFSLQDRTKPGHRRFIALWLVDPHRRIISTANVPPQQLDWWAESVFGAESSNVAKSEIPPELLHLLLEQGLAKKLNLPEDVTKALTSRLPAEIMDMVRNEGVLPEGLMTPAEALQHRIALMEERSQFHQLSKQNWEALTFSFCEH